MRLGAALLLVGSLLATFLVGSLDAPSATPSGGGQHFAAQPLPVDDASTRSSADLGLRSLAPCLVPSLAVAPLLLDELEGRALTPLQDEGVPPRHDELEERLRAAPPRAGPAQRAG